MSDSIRRRASIGSPPRPAFAGLVLLLAACATPGEVPPPSAESSVGSSQPAAGPQPSPAPAPGIALPPSASPPGSGARPAPAFGGAAGGGSGDRQPARPTEAERGGTQYTCGTRSMTVRYENAGQLAVLTLPDRTLRMARQVSGVGGHYADANGNDFKDRGQQAMLTLVGREPQACSAVPVRRGG